ncbi:MAG: hypothetical protein OQJ98_02360 [Candidatus Pacebacteria bacterium]|nr:hypothetical protein [Candidatus Paceibacterota bacterium]
MMSCEDDFLPNERDFRIIMSVVWTIVAVIYLGAGSIIALTSLMIGVTPIAWIYGDSLDIPAYAEYLALMLPSVLLAHLGFMLTDQKPTR